MQKFEGRGRGGEGWGETEMLLKGGEPRVDEEGAQVDEGMGGGAAGGGERRQVPQLPLPRPLDPEVREERHVPLTSRPMVPDRDLEREV